MKWFVSALLLAAMSLSGCAHLTSPDDFTQGRRQAMAERCQCNADRVYLNNAEREYSEAWLQGYQQGCADAQASFCGIDRMD